MKKLLYTLLLGLVVISCEKDMDGDTYSIAAPSQEIEAKADTTDFDAVIDRLTDIAHSKSSNNLTSRSTVSAGDSFTLLFGFETTNSYYEFVIDDSYSICNDETFLTEVVFTYKSAALTEISLGGSVIRSLPRDLSSLYGVDWKTGWKFDSTGVLATITSEDGSVFDFGE